MKKNVLFISDSSLTNPILHSQGLPLLESLFDDNYKCYLITFESPNTIVQYNNLKKKFASKIILNTVEVNPSLFLPGWFQIYYKGLSKCYKIVKNHNIKIVHARSFNPSLIVLTIVLVFFPSIKFIFDIRGLFIEEEIYKGKLRNSDAKVGLLRILEKIMIKKANAIVVVSKAFRNHLVSNLEIKIKNIKEKIIVIPNGAPILEKNDVVGLQGNKTFVTGVYSGSTAKWQSIPDLIELCKMGINKISNFRMKIFTYDDPNIIKSHFIGDEILEKTIDITNLDSMSVKNHLREGDFGILLREKHLLNKVSCPLKFGEYLASGLPVLVSEGVGDTENIINKYKVGVVVYNNDYEKALLDMHKLVLQTGIKNRCKESARKKFNLSTCIKLYKKIYQDLLSGQEQVSIR